MFALILLLQVNSSMWFDVGMGGAAIWFVETGRANEYVDYNVPNQLVEEVSHDSVH